MEVDNHLFVEENCHLKAPYCTSIMIPGNGCVKKDGRTMRNRRPIQVVPWNPHETSSKLVMCSEALNDWVVDSVVVLSQRPIAHVQRQ